NKSVMPSIMWVHKSNEYGLMPITLPNSPEFIQVQTTQIDNGASIEKGPLVSFVIPVLNGEKDIARCLLSLRSLDFSAQRYEIIVMDNGSTDRTREIVCGFGVDLQVVPGVNVGALRNRGGSLAHGNYVAFVDADVELDRDWLQNGLECFRDQKV